MAGNEPVYTPTREEITYRCEAMLWMQAMEWDMVLIEEIMLNDNPCLETVRHLVYKLGPDRACEAIAEMNGGFSGY